MDNTSINRQYSYTSRTELESSIIAKVGWLRIKDGQTFRDVNVRIREQDTSSTTSDLILISKPIAIENNDSVFDNKIRTILHTMKHFQKYERVNHKDKRHEWSYVYIADICKKCSISLTDTDMLDNPQFLKLLSNRIYNAKQKAIKRLLGITGHTEFVPNKHQTKVIEQLIAEDNKYILLSLAPRFGKTITILEYVKCLHKQGINNIILIPTSKDLASNTSFINDYEEGRYNRYFEIFHDASLFKKSKKIIDGLNTKINKDHYVILVTDEADRASHTRKSIEKMDTIGHLFNIRKHIVMSGTGIFKAAKIFKGVHDTDISFIQRNYSELIATGDKHIVRRNMFNMVYDISDISSQSINAGEKEVLNFGQAFKQPYTYTKLSEYIMMMVDDSMVATQLGLQRTKAIMIFVNTIENVTLNNFINWFNVHHGDRVASMEISGNTTTNGGAQKKVTTMIDTMRKNKDKRQLVIFSKGMGSRSFSVPLLRRVILFTDTELSAQGYQSISRCLTYNRNQSGIQTADIFKCTFESSLELSTELFMLETNAVTDNDLSNEKVRVFLKNNSIVNVILDNEGIIKTTTLGDNTPDVLAFIDKILKITDSVKYAVTKLYGLGIKVDGRGKRASKDIVKIVDDSPSPNIPRGKSKVDREDERALEYYIRKIRCLPYITDTGGLITNDVDELMLLDWDDYYIRVDKEIFRENLLNDDFRDLIDGIWRASHNEEDREGRLLEYLELIDGTIS